MVTGDNMENRIEKIIRRSKAFEFAQKGKKIYWFSKLLLGIFILVSIVVFFLPWQQTSQGYGKITAFSPGQKIQNLTSPLEGRIKQWNVREGQKVKPGDVIAELEDIDPQIISRIEEEIAAVKRKIRSMTIAFESAKNDVSRQEKLVVEGISSPRSLEIAKIKLAQQQNDLAAADAELARLEVKLSRQSMQNIEARIPGTINSILAGENYELIKPGQPLATIVPDSDERYAEVFIPAQDLPFIKVGQSVLLQLEGWPILQLSGLPELSIGTFKGQLKIIDSADDGNGFFRLIIEPKELALWPKPELLRQGLRVKAWVQMQKVPLWFEIWRNLLSLPPQPLTKDLYTRVNQKEGHEK